MTQPSSNPLLIAAALLLAACSPNRKVDGMDARSVELTDIDVWTDPGTGCQYLMDTPASYRGGMTPRMKPDGTQVCEQMEKP